MEKVNSTQSQPAQRVNSSTALILGGSGFIGTRLVALLLETNQNVRIGDLRRSECFPELSDICDVRDEASLKKITNDVSVIVNLAAEHRDDVRPVSSYHETNVQGAVHVCNAARVTGIGKLVFTSSVAVYGFQSQPVNEDGAFAPFNEYGKTKLEAEKIYKAWAAEDATRTLVIVRPTVVFGEGNRGNVYNLLHQIASGRFLMVGSGTNVKSMAYVGNLAAFLVHTLSLVPGVHIFNYVDGPDMAMSELVGYIRNCLGKPGRSPRILMPAALAVGYFLDTVARISNRKFPISAIRVRKFCESTQFLADRVRICGFIPPFSLQEGLERTIQSEFPK